MNYLVPLVIGGVYLLARPVRSRYYDMSVFDSPDAPGSGRGMNRKFIRKIDRSIDEIGYVPTVTSGVRTEQHNHNVGGVYGSWHIFGRGLDWIIPAYDVARVMQILRKNGLTAVWEGDHLHVELD